MNKLYYKEVNREVYDALAVEYKERTPRYTKVDRVILKPFISYLNKRFDNPRVLELGPGSGLTLTILNEAGLNTTAIDISSKMIEVAREVSPTTHFIHSDFLAYQFRNIKYEGIFAKAFIHLFPKKDAVEVLKKSYSLLCNDGILFIGTTIHDKPSEGFYEKADYKTKIRRYRKRWSEDELTKTILDCNYKILSVYHDFSDPEKKWMRFIISK